MMGCQGNRHFRRTDPCAVPAGMLAAPGIIDQLGELRYEFKEPLVPDGSNFVGAYPSFQCTPHDKAIQRTCDWFGQQLSLGR